MTRGHAKHLRSLIESLTVYTTDDVALTAVELFPAWDEAATYAVGDRVQDNGILYKCRMAHTAQATWTPTDAPTLWEAVSIEDGSREHPIHYAVGMALESGKYYTEDGKLYRCTRDTGVPVYNRLHDLIGIYVEEVSA